MLPIFLEQIKKGGPVTVTHKDMQRYFMTVSEAVALVLQASVIGKGGQIMVLNMGKPIKIVELAKELIRLHGLEPYKDIKIEFIGLRPGEKIYEELFTEKEKIVATSHERVFIAKNVSNYSLKDIENLLANLKNILNTTSDKDLYWKIKNILKNYVKFYEN